MGYLNILLYNQLNQIETQVELEQAKIFYFGNDYWFSEGHLYLFRNNEFY